MQESLQLFPETIPLIWSKQGCGLIMLNY